ncbi:acetyltransferase [Candidatus Thiomargarita nelsonii]|uniref:Acetyltransferase n=1 Tax=Candidatus Thiomargarita nelsonii TaxID=1003181 RepID=A0A176RWW3_9GAMM|nr:acetyltransferase [Candidatus Thiomargarita nelsonii]
MIFLKNYMSEVGTLMEHRLSSYTANRANNFNLIRFVAAFMVLFNHSFALSIGSEDADPLKGILGMTFGSIAVDIFFITSGFLITGSLLTRNNLIAFIWARVLRIYPALIVAIIFCTFIVGLYFTTLSIYSYLSSPEIYKFFLRNISLFLGVDYSLPGVFENIPYKRIVNGSLWTLPWEIRMYSILGLLWGILFYAKCFSNKFFNHVLVAIAVLAIISHILNHFLLVVDNNAQGLRLLAMFFVGAAFYVLKDKIILSNRVVALMSLILVFSMLEQHLFFVFYNIFIAYIVFYVAYIPSGTIRKFNRVGDYSYGMYIYAFPVQQSIAAIIQGVSVVTMLIVSLSITLILAILSWHLVEKKLLKIKHKYVVFENLLSNIRLTKPSRRT